MTDLLKGKTSKVLLSMSLPISIGMLSTFLFQIIDTYFVGQLGPDALAALSFASTIYFLMIGLLIGLSVGVSIMIGMKAGAKNIDGVRQTTRVSLFVGFVLSALLSAVCILARKWIFTALGAEPNIIPAIEQYIVPILFGIPVLALAILGGSALRSTGNVVKPEVLMALAGAINLVLDYLLIFGKWGFPEMGIQGAAYATVISWVFILIGMTFLLIKDKLLSSDYVKEKKIGELVKNIFTLASPTIATQIIGPATLMFMTLLLARQSPMAVAAFGVSGRIEMLLMIGILGFSTAMTPFIAQNSGAHMQSRIDNAIAIGGRASMYLGILSVIVLYLFIKPIAGIFSDDAQIVDYTAKYFYIVSLSYVFYGLFLITTSVLNGLQHTLNSLKITVVKSFAFTVPLTLLGTHWGVEGIFVGLALGNVLAGIYSGYEMHKEFKRIHSSLENHSVWQDYKNDFNSFLRFLSRKK